MQPVANKIVLFATIEVILSKVIEALVSPMFVGTILIDLSCGSFRQVKTVLSGIVPLLFKFI